MTQQTTSTKKNGFVHSGVPKSQDGNRSPIYGYRDLTVTSLEEAVKGVTLYVPRVEAYAYRAKQDCYKENTDLTPDESAAIYLYTMPTTLFHSELNDRLRAENRDELEPWFAFLKLFITALGKLPSLTTTVWRGVASDISSNFIDNPLQTWWTVNSCSLNPRVIECYLDGKKGTVFGIEVIHGKDISKYSAISDEQEVVLMPGTRIRVMGQPLHVEDKPYIISLKECGAIPEGKHVMLSYHENSKDIVRSICQILQSEHIPVWFNEQEHTNNMYHSLADGVENAAIVCCFVTPDYEKSVNCKFELQYAQKRFKRIIPCLLSDPKVWKLSEWLEPIITGLIYTDLHDISQPNIHSKVEELIDRINEQSPGPQHLLSKRVGIPSYLFELIRYEYQRNSRIKRIMNPSKSFPIEQSYINLAIVKAKEQHEKEKQLRDVQHVDAIMDTFEEIYGMKTDIDIKDIFEKCKNQEKQVLVFGRAGIGKSIFCRYVAYQWATGSYWSQYELLVLVPLRRLTTNRYPLLPSGQNYSLIDLVKKEVFQYDLSEKEEKLLRKHFDAKKTVWILDGYDEIVQNVPTHLECLFEQLLKTPHHILTSRPYLNTLSYDVQMEITGFTDNNIGEYVNRFFNQLKGEVDDVTIKSEKLLEFLESNRSIWGIAHIPVNLELICSLWSNEDLPEIEELTITALYTRMTEWLCRRYLLAQNIPIQKIPKKEIYQRCQKELAFLESLAFNAMQNNTILIRPRLLETALDEANVSLQEYQHVLNIGVLKSFNKQGIGTQIETDKDHYFIHLSFQEYFAACYLVNALKGNSTEKCIEFIKYQKYNQRYALVFSFASGLSEADGKSGTNAFWDPILGEPLDQVGIRHLQLIISCMEETYHKTILPQYTEVLESITKCIEYSFYNDKKITRKHLTYSFQRAQSVVCHQTFITMLIDLLQNDIMNRKEEVLSFISELKISNPSAALITSITTSVNDKSTKVRESACEALGKMGEKAATNEVISKLVSALGDESELVRQHACEALGKMGEKAATNEVISKLVSALGDESHWVMEHACEALGKMGEKAATNEVISKLVSALGDESHWVMEHACEALGKMGEKAATNEMISKLLSALEDERDNVRSSAFGALGKMGEKAATNEVISKLVSCALEDENIWVRPYACEALGKMGEKGAMSEVISKLVSALEDESVSVRVKACQVLGKMDEKAATNEVISKLVSCALEDENIWVRPYACEALGKMGEKGAMSEVISKLVNILGDANEDVRQHVCEALGKMGEKAATNEVINKLVNALGDESEDVRESACYALGEMGEKAATNEVISKLVSALGDESHWVMEHACEALGKMGEKAATNEVISKLLSALEDESEEVRSSAFGALGKMGEKPATNEVISKLLSALGYERDNVRRSAFGALGKMGGKAATNEVISNLVSALGDESQWIRLHACEALGMMGEKAATNEVISKLVSCALEDENIWVRPYACEALGKMGEKGAMSEVISKLVSALEDESVSVRVKACQVLGKMDEKAATNEVISKLVSCALEDENIWVRPYACEALGKMGEKGAMSEVISKLVNILGDANEDVRQHVCEALGKMGEKAATNEVINKLVNALGDESEDVRESACYALGEMGEKAATNEVISKLVSALGDESHWVMEHACEALGKMGEKPATNEVISKLLSALGDERDNVRRSAFGALGKMGGKAATNEVISNLVSALGDESQWIRLHACEALGMMGEKAATNEVISKLVSCALEDENIWVRPYACEALGKMGEKGAMSEVISKLVNILGDANEDVRQHVCEALGKMGEKAATNEVINKLVNALGDESEDVRESACYALGEMGEKAATNEVISKLVSALGDESHWVMEHACEALGKMGEKAATNEVISKLLSALEDESEEVRSSAFGALGKMGEKAATNEVISKLLSALGDESEEVRSSAFGALGKMGGKAATNEVISNLVSALGDESQWIRLHACEALGMMGEKAATNEVISKLLNVLGDESDDVRRYAYEALGRMGEKAATNEVISKLIVLIDSGSWSLSLEAANAIGNISNSSVLIAQLDPKVISKLCQSEHGLYCLKNISADQLFKCFFTSKNRDWLSAVTYFTLLQGAAVIVTLDKVVVYDRKEPVELSVPSLELRQQIIEAFTNQDKRLPLSFEIPSEVGNQSLLSFWFCNIL